MPDPVVFLPGLMCDSRLFSAQILALSRSRSVQVVVPQADGIEAMSQAVLDATPARFALVGLGLGAHVALDVLRRDAGRVTRLVLISSDPLVDTPAAAAARDRRMILAQTGRLLQAMAEEVPKTALMPGEGRDGVLDLCDDMALGLGEAVYLHQSRALQRRRDQQKTLRRAVLPALILAGAHDTLIPPRRQGFMADLMPTARLQVIEDAGAMPSLEAPDEVTAALTLFLNGPLVLR